MKVTRSLTHKIFIPSPGKYYFGDITAIRGKKVLAIVPTCSDQQAAMFVAPPYNFNEGNQAALVCPFAAQLNDIAVYLTPDGQNYTHQGISAYTLANTFTLGQYHRIDSVLSPDDCYVMVDKMTEGNTPGYTLQFVIFYEDSLHSAPDTSAPSHHIAFNVTLPKGDTQALTYLGDQPKLAGHPLRRLSLALPTISSSALTGVDDSILLSAYITLVSGTTRVIDQLPLAFIYNVALYEILSLANLSIDYDASYIEYVPDNKEDKPLTLIATIAGD